MHAALHPAPKSSLDLRCPLLPQTLMEAVAMLANPDEIEADAVTQMVERDPMLLARILKTVNSAYYGVSRTISSPSRAVMLLGPVTIVGLVAGMSVTRLRPTGVPAAVSDQLVRHSLATAYLGQFIVDLVEPGARPAQSGEAYTAGLLHDLGKFVLLHNFPDEGTVLYHDRVAPEDGDDREMVDRERGLFGCDHTEAGVIAAHTSGFPDALVQLIRLHHSPDALSGEGVDASVAFLVRVTVAASHGASLLGHLPTAGPDGADERRLADPVWDALVCRDLPSLGSADALLAQLRAEAPRLDQYIETLMAPVATS